MPLLLSGLRLVLRKVMEQHREHVHTVQYGVKVGFYPRDTRIREKIKTSVRSPRVCMVHGPSYAVLHPSRIYHASAVNQHTDTAHHTRWARPPAGGGFAGHAQPARSRRRGAERRTMLPADQLMPRARNTCSLRRAPSPCTRGNFAADSMQNI